MTTTINALPHDTPDIHYPLPRIFFRPPSRLIFHYHLMNAHTGLTAPVKKIVRDIDGKGQLSGSAATRLFTFLFHKAAADGIPGLRQLLTVAQGSMEGHGIGVKR